MKANIVGFGGLAAATCLIRNAGLTGGDIALYEAEPRMGGGFTLGGGAATGYSLPGSVFDAEFCCTFDLLRTIPFAGDPAVSVKDEFFAIDARAPFNDRGHIADRNGRIVRGWRFGLSLRDGLDLVKRGPPPVYQGRHDPKALLAALRVLVCG